MKLSRLVTAALEIKRTLAENGLDLGVEVLIDVEYVPVAVREIDWGISVTAGRPTAHLLLTPERDD